MASPAPSIDLASRTRLRIMRRLIPYLFVLYIINYLDRVNVSYAALEMTHDLSFTPEILGFGAGNFSSAIFCSKFRGRF